MLDEDTIHTPLTWDLTAYEWRALIASPYCYNLTATQKHIVTVISFYGKKYGEDIFPSQREIAFRAGVSVTYVNKTAIDAASKGWLIREMTPSGGARVSTQYYLAIPVGVHDHTAFLKRRFWLPPYKYELLQENEGLKLVKRHADVRRS